MPAISKNSSIPPIKAYLNAVEPLVIETCNFSIEHIQKFYIKRIYPDCARYVDGTGDENKLTNAGGQ